MKNDVRDWTNEECVLICLQLKKAIKFAKENGIDLSKECEPLKEYNGKNLYLLDLKNEAKNGGFI